MNNQLKLEFASPAKADIKIRKKKQQLWMHFICMDYQV